MHVSDYWPPPSVHREYWELHHNPHVYEYDAADDGPEWYTLRVILASHQTRQEIERERFEYAEALDMVAARLGDEILAERLRNRGARI